MTDSLTTTPLGKNARYEEIYNPTLLCGIKRAEGYQAVGIDAQQLPFHGMDIWNAYELSWLNSKGKPEIGIAEIQVPSNSLCIVESKSLKLYLGSFNQTRFNTREEVIHTIESDLSSTTHSTVMVKLFVGEEAMHRSIDRLQGINLDLLDIEVSEYQLNDALLTTELGAKTSETLYSHLLRSNCPVTGQPDWASVLVSYQGQPISHEGLLRYLISFRKHSEFHEQCVERIFMDIMKHCQPEHLSVYARFTRRGGIDINPFRSNFETGVGNLFLPRQ